MELYMKEIGKTTNSMEKEKKFGQTVPRMKETISMDKNTAKANFSGQMVLHMKESFLIII